MNMRARIFTVLLLLCCLSLWVGAASSLAIYGEKEFGEGPGLVVTAQMYPTQIAAGSEGAIDISVFDTGAKSTTGPVTVTDTLPPGLVAIDAGGQAEYGLGPSHTPELWDCTGTSVVTCKNDPTNLPSLTGGGGAPGYQTGRERLDPPISIEVKAAPGASGRLLNHVMVTGGDAPTPASTSEGITISNSPAPFGISDFDVWFTNADGTSDTQAGSHPYATTFALSFNQLGAIHKEGNEYNISSIHVSEQPRNIEVELPPGLVGDPQGVPQCPRELFENDEYRSCPADTQIGIATVKLGDGDEPIEPVFNVAPPTGHPADFGFTIVGIPTNLSSRVRTGTDDGITTDIFNSPQRNIQSSVVTIWSDPGDPSHAPWSGAAYPCTGPECTEHLPDVSPLLTLPTACAGPQKFTVRAHPWFNEAITSEETIVSHDADQNPVGFTGCEHLAFAPTITAAPDTSKTDTPAGLTVDVTPSAGGLLSKEGLSSADIQNTTVILPEGFVINPGQAAGLAACQPGQDGIGSESAPSCPPASKVGVVSISTPLLSEKVEGDVYVLQSNPPEVKLLVAGSAEGINLKFVGVVHLNEQTGRLTTKFEGTPELPFTDFKLSFSGGPQAALDTPTQCGVYEASADFTPWSSPFVGDFLTGGDFDLSEGPNGSPCPSSPLPFNPSMVAGSTTDQAGGFTGFSLLLQRGDGQQRIEKLQFKAPAGLSGMISSVPLCQEPQAEEGDCPSTSHIGHAVVTSGPGPYPLVIPQPGEPEASISLTGPYEGAPFGLSIVTPVIAGPFNLGTIVTRAKIEIDPSTAQITITTDPLPQIVKGVPTDLRSIDSVIDRPGFMFNPTNCNPQEFSGTATSTGGAATAPISSHFGVGSCRSLEFHPKISVTTIGHASKAKGTSLKFKISYPKGAQGSESWFNEAKFDLPKQIPARLATIQKACADSTFAANPGNCPGPSKIGTAVVRTPVLPVPLEGPIYFVSHGGAKFPDAVIVLHGDGVAINLRGETFINGKTGITSATFRNTPDVPFESIEVSLPAGQFSEFGVNLPSKDHYSFCGQKLKMPTLFKAQNGLEIHQSTPVAISGCPKAKAKKAKKNKKAAKKK